jgi:hypothetical protein
MSTRRVLVAAVLLTAAFATLSLWEMSGDSLTTDERWHLPVGYAYWRTGEFRLSPEHPPLAKLLCAAPLLSMDLRLPPVTPPAGKTWHDYPAPFGSAFFRLNPDVDRILFRSRLPVVAMGLLLVLTIFFWSWRLHGEPGAGLLSLALAALEPTLLAHSHYVTTDMALASFGVLAFAALWCFAATARLWSLALAVVAMGLALAAKFSALVLLPIFLLLLVLRWPAQRPASPATGRLPAAIGALALMAVIVQATYFFSPDLALYLRGPGEVRAYLPVDYPAYVLGTFHVGGVWWYAPFAWLIKTPLPTMVVIALGLVLCLHHPGRARDTLRFVLAPAGVYGIAVCLLTANLGVRYLIPTTAFLLVAAGAAYRWLAATRFRRAATLGLGLWLAGSVLNTAPHFIAYFNELIGGPAHGAAVIHDSNLDWGQDLKRLARYQQEQRIPELVLFYWGGAQPEHYGVRYRPLTSEMARAATPPAGTYAISVNNLIDMKKSVVLGGGDPNLDWLARFRPVDRVGYSIYIYRFGS